MLGWLNIYAAVYNAEHHSILDVSQRYGKQMMWIIAAIVLAIFSLIIDEKFYNFFAYGIYAFIVLLLIGVLLIGKEINGARSWYSFGGVQIQPSEFAKFATGLALAKFMSGFNFKLIQRNSLLIIAAIILFPPLLIAIQPDMGSVLVYFSFFIVLFREGLSPLFPIAGIYLAALFILSLVIDSFTMSISMVFVAGIIYFLISRNLKNAILSLLLFSIIFVVFYFSNKMIDLGYSKTLISSLSIAALIIILFIVSIRNKIKYAIPILLLLGGSLFITYSVDYVFTNFLEDHQQKRINVLLGVEEDPQGAGYNVRQSKIAIGSGGISGKGFLKGTQTKYNFVPEQSTDFIFCTVGEEWGFLGTLLVILLFISLLLRLLYLAEKQKSKFSRIYGYSVISILFFHFIINIGMTIGLFPVVGIPLPFFSYGGSSLWSFTILLFIFIRLDAGKVEIMR